MRYLLPVVLVSLCGCAGDDQTLQGEIVGEFEAEGLLSEQTCGDTISSPESIDLDFTLSVDEDQESRVYIELDAGVFSGTRVDGEYVFQVVQTWTVIEPSGAETGCYVTQEDVLSITLESSDEGAPRSASGSQTSEFEPVAGSDCTSALTASGGVFLTLPCRVRYVVAGDET